MAGGVWEVGREMNIIYVLLHFLRNGRYRFHDGEEGCNYEKRDTV